MKKLEGSPFFWPGQPASEKSGWSFDQSCHTLSGALFSGNASWDSIQPPLSLEGKFCAVAFSNLLPPCMEVADAAIGLDELSRAPFNGFSY